MLKHPILFWINLGLIFYTLWGYLSPIDFFWHPGTTFYRVVTSSTLGGGHPRWLAAEGEAMSTKYSLSSSAAAMEAQMRG